MLQEKAITDTKNTIISYLRSFLKNKDNYKSITNNDFSECEIYDKLPEKLQYWPSILITSINGNFIPSGLGDMAEEIYDDNGTTIAYRFSGMLELPITIEVATMTTPERDELLDLITIALRVLLRRQMEAEGVLIKNDMRYSGESEISYLSNKVYIGSIQFSTWSEWYRDIPLLPITGINIEQK